MKKSLPALLNNQYRLWIDNFFTGTKLLKALSSLGVAACGTAKPGSGYPKQLQGFCVCASKSQDWGTQAHMVTKDKILCLAWVDLSVV